MQAMTVERLTKDANASPDLSWSGLYRAGGIAAFLFIVLTFASGALIALTPQPPSTGETGTLPGGVATLQYIAAHKSVYLLNMIVFVGPVSITAVVFLALYVALKRVSQGTAAVGAVVGIASLVLCVAPLGLLFSLVPLSNQYAAASTAAQRTMLATTADGLLAQINSVSIGGVLYAVGVLIISLAMLHGVFPRAVAYVGIVSGIVGIVSESLRPVMGAWYGIYGIMLLWLLAVGWKLLRLSGKEHRTVGQ